MITPQHILISRTDSIGDVMLTLPLCAAIKEKFPDCTLSFLGKTYTKDVISSYKTVDHFINWSAFEEKSDEECASIWRDMAIDTIIHVFPNKRIGKIAKLAGIQNRIGTSHRLHHWFTCNIRPNFTRKNSDLHESQLNFKLAEPIGIKHTPTLKDIQDSTRYFHPQPVELPAPIAAFLHRDRKTYILHPKSQGSALEWPIGKYISLAEELIAGGNQVAFTGTEGEGALFRQFLPSNEHLLDTTGQLTLEQLIHLIHSSAGLVACSTGPLHIAAFSGIKAVGLYSSRRPIHPGRWMPIGPQAKALVFDPNCPNCAKGAICHCIENIPVEKVISIL